MLRINSVSAASRLSTLYIFPSKKIMFDCETERTVAVGHPERATLEDLGRSILIPGANRNLELINEIKKAMKRISSSGIGSIPVDTVFALFLRLRGLFI